MMMMMVIMYKVIRYIVMSMISNLMSELLNRVADEGHTKCIFLNKNETHYKHCITNIFLKLIVLMRPVLISLP
jgi:hypothetical protein